MRINIIAFTEGGEELAKRISNLKICFDNGSVDFNVVSKDKEIVRESFERGEPLIFVGACGIAVRLIAPFVKDKLTDIPVLVIDEKGMNVIPILSGHYGGANELAQILADEIDATAVITTATDINDKFAIDVFAKKNDLFITDKAAIAKISSKVLKGEKISFYIEKSKAGDKIRQNLLKEKDASSIFEFKDENENSDVLITSKIPDSNNRNSANMILIPKRYVIGIGCKKGKSFEEIEEFVLSVLREKDININLVSAIASIDVKKDEEGIILFAEKYGIIFVTYTKEELESLSGDFSSSEFVKDTVGVDNVCERAAVKAGAEGELIVKKIAKDGITVAVSEIV